MSVEPRFTEAISASPHLVRLKDPPHRLTAPTSKLPRHGWTSLLRGTMPDVRREAPATGLVERASRCAVPLVRLQVCHAIDPPSPPPQSPPPSLPPSQPPPSPPPSPPRSWLIAAAQPATTKRFQEVSPPWPLSISPLPIAHRRPGLAPRGLVTSRLAPMHAMGGHGIRAPRGTPPRSQVQHLASATASTSAMAVHDTNSAFWIWAGKLTVEGHTPILSSM